MFARIRSGGVVAATLVVVLAFGGCEAGSPTGPDGMVESSAPSFSFTPGECRVIDFEEFAHGDEIDGAAALSLFGIPLTVTTYRFTNDAGSAGESWPARAFDTGDGTILEDGDLTTTGAGGICTDCGPLGNIIVIEDPLGFATDGDSRFGGTIAITGFSGLPGLRVTSFTTVDDDDGPLALEVDDVVAGASTPGADGNVQTVPVDATIVNKIELVLPASASGGFDDIVICAPPGGGEGCTPGYWKNHTSAWPAPYTTGTTFGSVFTSCGAGDMLQRPEGGSVCGKTLLQALRLRGGGLNALARHAVAGLLDSKAVDYDLTTAEVIALVNGALAANSYADAHGTLVDYNEQYCPLN